MFIAFLHRVFTGVFLPGL